MPTRVRADEVVVFTGLEERARALAEHLAERGIATRLVDPALPAQRLKARGARRARVAVPKRQRADAEAHARAWEIPRGPLGPRRSPLARLLAWLFGHG